MAASQWPPLVQPRRLPLRLRRRRPHHLHLRLRQEEGLRRRPHHLHRRLRQEEGLRRPCTPTIHVQTVSWHSHANCKNNGSSATPNGASTNSIRNERAAVGPIAPIALGRLQRHLPGGGGGTISPVSPPLAPVSSSPGRGGVTPPLAPVSSSSPPTSFSARATIVPI